MGADFSIKPNQEFSIFVVEDRSFVTRPQLFSWVLTGAEHEFVLRPIADFLVLDLPD